MNDAVKRGARVLAGGKRPAGEAYAKGNFYQPTLVVDVDENSRLVQEEVFGPALPIMRVGSLAEAIEKANATQAGSQMLPRALWGLGALIIVGVVVAFLATKV